MKGILAAASVLAVASAKVVDYANAYPLSTHECWKKDGVTQAIARAWRSYGSFDPNAPTNIAHCHSAGFAHVDIYMFPCRGKSATTQVAEMIKGMEGHDYGKIWLDIETNPSSGCSWTQGSGSSNCHFVTELVDAVKSHGKVPGIYSSYYMWESIMGGAKNCAGVSEVPIWYAHYDNTASFSDWKDFGGWKKPFMKQYKGDESLCGADVDISFV